LSDQIATITNYSSGPAVDDCGFLTAGDGGFQVSLHRLEIYQATPVPILKAFMK